MAIRLPSIPWKAVFRGVVVAYGISFVSGLVFFATGLTPQTDRVLYPLLALLSGAIGVAVALRVDGRSETLASCGLGTWALALQPQQRSTWRANIRRLARQQYIHCGHGARRSPASREIVLCLRPVPQRTRQSRRTREYDHLSPVCSALIKARIVSEVLPSLLVFTNT